MHEHPKDGTDPMAADATTPAAKKHYQSPTLSTYGNVRDLTMMNAAGPNFDGGGGANIYAS